MAIPRPEYPRPQFARERWLCLNGPWRFEVDPSDDGLQRGLLHHDLETEILVPFCPESRLSGIGETSALGSVWYRRDVEIPPEWAGSRVLLNFQAVDYDTTVWVDSAEVVRHRGGWTPFTADLGIREESELDLTIVTRARDLTENYQPRGKQCDRPEPWGDQYTRTTGIWQTVWLEPVGETYMLRPRITPDLSSSAFHLEIGLRGPQRGLTMRATLRDLEEDVTTTEVACGIDFSPRLTLSVPEHKRRLWSPDDPFLYDIHLELLDSLGTVIDSADSYAGLRSLAIEGTAILLNGAPKFQRLVLNQGYYPDGVMTAASEEELVADITLARAAGFDGARLHEKVFEERFLYHCDRLGHLVWGEFGAGLANARWSDANGGDLRPPATLITQWLETLERDYSHPSIVGWCALNESVESIGDGITALDDVTRGAFLAAKAMDQTRPVLDVSGFAHRVAESDVYDSHSYEHDPDTFAARIVDIRNGAASSDPDVEELWEALTKAPLSAHGGDGSSTRDVAEDALAAHLEHGAGSREEALRKALPPTPWSIPYRGQPFFFSEFGGIWWPSADETQTGDVEDGIALFEALVTRMLDDKYVFGYCYTQLTDILQERNGIYSFDRTPKLDVERLRVVQSRRAAIELGGVESVSPGAPS